MAPIYQQISSDMLGYYDQIDKQEYNQAQSNNSINRIILHMNSSYSDEEFHTDKMINRSCNQKIQDDTEQTQRFPVLKFKTTKSQNQLKKLEQDECMTALHEQWKRNQEMRQKTAKQKTDIMRHSNKNELNCKKKVIASRIQLPAFEKGKDLVDSQEISIEDSGTDDMERPQGLRRQNNQEIKIIQQRRKKELQQLITLNILILGKRGVGKTSFIDCFSNKNYESSPIIHSKTEILNISTVKNQSDNLQVRLIDMPGYEEVKAEQYINEVQAFINKKYEDHLNKINDKFTLRSEIKDERVHCCLFFLSGPWICESDWTIMKKIENITNIIPIVAKGDTFTTRQIKEFKRKIFQRNKMMNVNWFSVEEILRRFYPQKLKPLLQGTFGRSPPFVITCCNEKQYNQLTKKNEFVRQFKWGKVELNNQSHSDFKFLKSLLVYYLSESLIRYTQVSMTSFNQKMIQRRLKIKEEARRQNSLQRRIQQEASIQVHSNRSQQVKEQGDFIEIVKNYLPIGLTLAGLIGTLIWIRKSSQS